MDSEMIAIKSVTEVSQLLDIPPGTLRQWEKDFEGFLEVPRDTKNTRYYMNSQIEMIKAIKDLRAKGLSIEQIRDLLSEHNSGESVTPFEAKQTDKRHSSPENVGLVTSEQLLNHISQLLSEKLHEQEERFQAQLSEIMTSYKQLAPALQLDPMAQKQEWVTQRITERRIIAILEHEALQQWNQKPESERLTKVGLFRKEEDRNKKDQFIKSYVDQYFEARMKEAYGLE